MTSLVKQMECLNKDIDNCKSKIENCATKRSSCPPSCYCCNDKAIQSDRLYTSSATRRKTVSATVTKTDISPRLDKDPPKSSECLKSGGASVRTGSVEIRNCMDHHSCVNKQARMENIPNECLNEDGCNVEPVKLPKKSLKKEPSWGSILQQNNRLDCKENCHSVKKDGYTQVYSSSSSSVISSAPVYMKNKGIQCEDISIPKKKQTFSHNCDVNTIEYHLMNLKDKLKDHPSLSKLLEEMDKELRGTPHDRGDCPLVYEIKERQQHHIFDKLLHPRPNFYKQTVAPTYDMARLESTYLELEGTCAKLKKERDAALEKASQKSAELVESMKREVETKTKLTQTNTKIKEMSAKLETYTKSMEGLTEHVKRLQNENKDIERIRGQVTQLSNMMHEVTQENKNLLAELQLITIERNKLQVELAIKEQELEKKVKELEKMSNIIMESSQTMKQINGLHNQHEQRRPDEEMLAANYLISVRDEIRQPQLVASSPNSSSSDSVLHARINSWIAMSSISNVDQQIEHAVSSSEAKIDPRKYNRGQIKVTKNMATSTGGLSKKALYSKHRRYLNHHITNEEPLSPPPQPETAGKQPNIGKIEKLKEEIRHMFSEMRELAHDVPSVPLVDYSSAMGSSDINWSEVSFTSNSYDTISEFHSSEFDFLRKHIK